mmetsp:Transcript_16095/g.24155  ORF Transcript_16095/g.24155 Transcript_16095/m.24155 type:complete len:302 (+) Transcript_16095:65-970(+)
MKMNISSPVLMCSMPLLLLLLLLLMFNQSPHHFGECFTHQQQLHHSHPHKHSRSDDKRLQHEQHWRPAATFRSYGSSKKSTCTNIRSSNTISANSNVCAGKGTTALFMSSSEPEQQHKKNKNRQRLSSATTTTKRKQQQKQQKQQPNSNGVFNYNYTSVVVNTLSILGLSSAFVLFWSEISILLKNCSPSTTLLPVEIERSAYISSFLFASATNLSKIIFGCSMTELLLLEEEEEGEYGVNVGNTNYNDNVVKPLERALFYATEVVAFMAVVSAFAVVVWQIVQGVDNVGSDGRWCQLMNE